MTNREILEIAMKQSAEDIGCRAEDFSKNQNVVVEAKIGSAARKYLTDFACNFVCYGNNVVAAVKNEYRTIVEEYLGKFEFYHCFETPNMLWLNEKLAPLGQKVCFMAEYFLPNVEKLCARPCEYKTKILQPKNFENLYIPHWSNALCADRKHLDVLGIGAYDDEKLVALAACSADCDTMWQIGVDVLPNYRRRGLATALVSNLALEILSRGKVPFYCCAWSNVRSARKAIKIGFAPAWVEMTVKPAQFVDKMNND